MECSRVVTVTNFHRVRTILPLKNHMKIVGIGLPCTPDGFFSYFFFRSFFFSFFWIDYDR